MSKKKDTINSIASVMIPNQLYKQDNLSQLLSANKRIIRYAINANNQAWAEGKTTWFIVGTAHGNIKTANAELIRKQNKSQFNRAYSELKQAWKVEKRLRADESFSFQDYLAGFGKEK